METKFRCNCPFTTALDILGDRWMLVIVKQILIEGKETFKDFTEAEEAIATNILTTKLKLLEKLGIVIKRRLPNNNKTSLYLLTDKGLALTPLLVEMAVWTDKYLRDIHPTIVNGQEMEFLRNDKTAFADLIVTKYKEKLLKI